jgi:hypothetical protein
VPIACCTVKVEVKGYTTMKYLDWKSSQSIVAAYRKNKILRYLRKS